MHFQPLELFIRIQVRVLVVESDHEAKMNQIWCHVIQETATVNVRAQRPSDRVLDQALAEMRITLSYLPHLFEANAIVLNANRVLFEVEFLLQAFGKRAPASFGEDGLLGHDIDARLETVLHGAVLGYTHIARSYTDHLITGIVI